VPLANQLQALSGERYRAHFFAGEGDGAYTSVFLHLHFGSARLLFTGDAHCEYEELLIGSFSEEDDFRADVLKVTHHGSSSGTAKRFIDAVRPALAIASTADDDGHRLEADTLERLGGRAGRRRVFETVVDGDIILRTDGRPYGGGVLYEVDFESPGALADAAKAEVFSLKAVNKKRTRSAHRACN
jgi:beta-lactamase superfamily II metal-dependent hydrolase